MNEDHHEGNVVAAMASSEACLCWVSLPTRLENTSRAKIRDNPFAAVTLTAALWQLH
jgi:hypothetical protein